jgi:hypothetical protein
MPTTWSKILFDMDWRQGDEMSLWKKSHKTWPNQFLTKLIHNLCLWKKENNNVGYFCNFHKTANSEQSRIGRKFTQSGHPVWCHLLSPGYTFKRNEKPEARCNLDHRGELWPPWAKLAPRGELCPLCTVVGVKILSSPLDSSGWGEHSPCVQSSPLEPSLPLGASSWYWKLASVLLLLKVRRLFFKTSRLQFSTYILRPFGIFCPFWYVAPRKIWQPYVWTRKIPTIRWQWWYTHSLSCYRPMEHMCV